MGEIHGCWFMGVGSQAGVHKPWVMGGSLWTPVRGWQRSLCPDPRMGKTHKVLLECRHVQAAPGIGRAMHCQPSTWLFVHASHSEEVTGEITHL